MCVCVCVFLTRPWEAGANFPKQVQMRMSQPGGPRVHRYLHLKNPVVKIIDFGVRHHHYHQLSHKHTHSLSVYVSSS